MGKRLFIAAIVISALLFSTMSGTQAVKVATANPVPLIPPTSPMTEAPQIVIQSPLSATYESPNVPLNFTVTGCRHGLTSPSPNIKDYHLDYVDYGIDGQECYLNFSNVLDNQSFSKVLTGLANGYHVVTIKVVAVSTYATNIISIGNNTYRYTENYYYPQTDKTVSFKVDLTIQTTPNSPQFPPKPSQEQSLKPLTSLISLPSPSPSLSPSISSSVSPTQHQTPSPTPIVDHSLGWIPYSIITAVAVVIIAALVYFRKIGRRT